MTPTSSHRLFSIEEIAGPLQSQPFRGIDSDLLDMGSEVTKGWAEPGSM